MATINAKKWASSYFWFDATGEGCTVLGQDANS